MRRKLLTLAFLALGTGVAAQTAPLAAVPAPKPAIGAPLSLAQARAVLRAATAEIDRRGFTMAVAIVEPDGTLVAFERHDGTQYGSIDVAQDKARSAALFRTPTADYAQAAGNGSPGVLSLRHAVAVEGGVPLLLDGRLVGAIGISGGSSKQDGEVARVATAALR